MKEIAAVIDQYAKHGWVIRRVMLSPASIVLLGAEVESIYPAAVVTESANEGLWFSRRSLPDREAWELRRLSGSPFALVAMLEDSMSEDEREEVLRETERRMFDGSHPEPTSH